jgi:hypothetical protein
MPLVLSMPRNSLFQRSLCRHPVLLVPHLVHGGLTSSRTYRAIRNITQLSTIADPQKSVKQ